MSRKREWLSGKANCLRVSDLELVRKARNGDGDAFHELMNRYAGELFALAVSLVGNVADAEDVLQETFSGAFRHLAAFAGRASVKTWLIRILVRQSARCRRTRKRHEHVALDGVLETSGGGIAGRRALSASSDLDTRMDLLHMLRTLSPEHREVIVLRELQGMTYDEIAETLGVPQGTVESRLFRARQGLRERLKDYLP